MKDLDHGEEIDDLSAIDAEVQSLACDAAGVEIVDLWSRTP